MRLMCVVVHARAANSKVSAQARQRPCVSVGYQGGYGGTAANANQVF